MYQTDNTVSAPACLPVSTAYIILTENTALYLGLRALFPETPFYLARPAGDYSGALPQGGERIVLLIDSCLLISGQWDGYFSLNMRYPHITRIWLGHRLTGRLLPDTCAGDGYLPVSLPVRALRKGILHLVAISQFYPQHATASPVLTRTEKMLLPWFLEGRSMFQVEQLTGITRKTLYLHRQHVMEKAGFTSAAFMSLVYRRSRDFLYHQRDIVPVIRCALFQD